MKKKKVIMIVCSGLTLICLFLLLHYDIGGQQIPVLLYHHFLTEEELKDVDNSDNYVVSVENFDKQLKYLHDNGYQSITLDQLYCWKKNKCNIPEKSFIVAIDDGLTSAHRYAEEILKKYNYTATLFTISSRTEEITAEWNHNNYQYIGYDIINSNGQTIAIGSHTDNIHRMINGKKAIETLSKLEINNDFKRSKEKLDTKYLAYPFNTYNKYAFQALKKNGYLLAFRGTNHKTYKNEYQYMISRIVVNNDFEYFKSIFETKKYNQNFFDKVKTDLLKIKKWVLK